MEVEQGKYEMHSLDFGAVEKVESQNIRALPPQLTFPTVSFSCIIDGRFQRLTGAISHFQAMYSKFIFAV